MSSDKQNVEEHQFGDCHYGDCVLAKNDEYEEKYYHRNKDYGHYSRKSYEHKKHKYSDDDYEIYGKRYECKKYVRDLNIEPEDGLLHNKIRRRLYKALKYGIIKYDLDGLLKNTLDQNTYNTLIEACNKIINKFNKICHNHTGRLLISLPDGTVVFDSSRGNNTYNNFKNNKINVNHNTRRSIMASQLYKNGTAYERKYSTTTQQKEIYVSIRLGKFRNSQGTATLSTSS